MIRSRYLALRVGQAFGIRFAGRHASNAAAELHLLREAEEMLGRLCWRDLEEIEDLSVEYWNLRKLDKEEVDLSGQISGASQILQQSHDQRADLLEKVVESSKDLVAEREGLIEKSERLGSERDLILREARAVKRRHDGLKAKLEVLTEEKGDSEELEDTKSEISELKKRFGSLRTRRDQLAGRIEKIDNSISEIDGRIETRRKDIREEAFGSYQSIGKANREISTNRAELGVIEKEMSSLFSEIGRYLSMNHSHPDIQPVLKTSRPLVNQMKALRSSINLNNILAGREATLTEG